MSLDNSILASLETYPDNIGNFATTLLILWQL